MSNIGGVIKCVIAPFRKSPQTGQGDILLLTRKESSNHPCNHLYVCLNTCRGEHVIMSKQKKPLLVDEEVLSVLVGMLPMRKTGS